VNSEQRSSFWKNRNVFVTGATGLLGPWLIKQLLSNQANITVLVRDSVPDSLFFTDKLHTKVTLTYGDLLDFHTLQRIINECNIDTIFHLGAQAIVGYANRSPISTFRSNIEGTWNLLETCRLSPWVKRIIVASSDKAYGNCDKLPYKEDTPLNGRYPYDASKSCADLIAQSYFHTYNLPVSITRCGNFFGGGDLHFNRIVPGTIKSIMNNENPIIRSNGTFLRDYIYVNDVVDAYLTLAEQLEEKNLAGESFNFSTDQPFTVIELVNLILQATNKLELKPIIQNQASHEIPAQHLSSEKAQRVLGWTAQYGVKKGIEETIKWYKNYFSQPNNVRPYEKSIDNCRML